MKKLSFLLGIILLLSSCTSNTIYEKPKNLIPKDSMVLLLKDLYVANSARNIKNINQQRRITYVPLVYKKYKIDSLRFQESNVYYISKVDEYRKLLEQVIEVLKEEKTEYEAIKKVKDSIVQDSIRKAKAILKNKEKKEKKK